MEARAGGGAAAAAAVEPERLVRPALLEWRFFREREMPRSLPIIPVCCSPDIIDSSYGVDSIRPSMVRETSAPSAMVPTIAESESAMRW